MINLLKNRANITIDDVKDALRNEGFDIDNPLMWEDKMFSENSDDAAAWINVILERSDNYIAEFLIVIGNDGSYIGHKTPLIIFSDSDDYGVLHERWRMIFKSTKHLAEILHGLKVDNMEKSA